MVRVSNEKKIRVRVRVRVSNEKKIKKVLFLVFS